MSRPIRTDDFGRSLLVHRQRYKPRAHARYARRTMTRALLLRGRDEVR